MATRLLAIQAQDRRGFRLAVRARCDAPTVAALDTALAEGELVVSWLLRGTLHLVASEDYWWLHSLVAPQQERPLVRRLGQLGIGPDVAERAAKSIAAALEDGPLVRSQLVAILRRQRLPNEGQGPLHLLALAAQKGLIVRGPMQGREQAYVRAADWLGPAPRVRDRARALAELVRRYLAGHGPAGERDLAKWCGLSLRECRIGLGEIAAELVERDDGLLALGGPCAPDAEPPPRLLGPFEPLLLGWAQREEVVGEHWPKLVHGGMFSAFALVGGRALATWRIERGQIDIAAFELLDDEARRLLDADAEAVLRYLDL